jgi:UDP-N-acetylglucosamine 2-epimerase (non-hydrolysing)
VKLLAVIGTRPEAIKMAPVVASARKRGVEVVVCATAQHRELLDQVLDLFAIRPEHDLDLMRSDQTLADLTSRAVAALDPVIAAERPDWLLVQGDTTTAMCGALAAFYRRVRVGHVEAGLRTRDLTRPFPEEMNRRVVDLVADAHFAPTERARRHLLEEGAVGSTVHVTGNTVVDALAAVRGHLDGPEAERGLPDLGQGERLVVVTAHRRESFGPGMRAIAEALVRLVAAHPDVRVVYPIHPNPSVREPMNEILGRFAARIHLVEPLAYLPFVRLMSRAYLVLSDSGGVQEEAPSLGVPALVLREVTERPEAVEAGAVRLVGVQADAIVAAASELLSRPEIHARMARVSNPYGDGRAAERIVAILLGEPWRPFSPDRPADEGP